VSWQETRSSDVTDTCPTPCLHPPAQPAESQTDSGYCCGRVNALSKTVTVIPRLTSDPAKNFSANEDFFRCFLDSANEYGFG